MSPRSGDSLSRGPLISEDCDILVIELGEDCKKDCQNISALLNSGSVKDIFLVLPRTEPEVLLQAMRSGAREFFPMPINKAEIVNALLKFKERNKSIASSEKGKKKGKIINIVGSKGGIGTTTTAVNFAASLLELQGARKSVALIDMNLLFGDIPLFLDIEAAFNWGEVAKNISRLGFYIFNEHSFKASFRSLFSAVADAVGWGESGEF